MNDQTRPVIALMGEFSAGKSTLTNLLLGEGRSPVKVTATQLPPVWFTKGDGPAIRVDLDGNETELSAEELHRLPVEDTLYARVPLQADLLDVMDIIDMPGNSDPNMSADVWKRVLPQADGVIWCTHANQAWRQSEAAVWDEVPPEMHDKSLLLLTRWDKILGDRDRSRILRRLEIETEGLFRAMFPVALLQAIEAADDRDAWRDSGAEAFVQMLMTIAAEVADRKSGARKAGAEVHDLRPSLASTPRPEMRLSDTQRPARPPSPLKPESETPAADRALPEDAAPGTEVTSRKVVLPRRVRSSSGTRPVRTVSPRSAG